MIVYLSSWLLHTEIHCAAARHPEVIRPETVSAVLDRLTLVDLTRGDLMEAPTRAGGLPSQDALHLTVALRVGAAVLITYDSAQAARATATGLAAMQPA